MVFLSINLKFNATISFYYLDYPNFKSFGVQNIIFKN